MSNEVGKKIQEIRKQQNMSQNELAKRSGLTQSWISRYERGDQLPGSKKLQTIAKALRVPISAFFVESKNLDGIMEFLNQHLTASEKQDLKHILEKPRDRENLFRLIELMNESPKEAGGLVQNLLALTGGKNS